jgi:hypothetical protein
MMGPLYAIEDDLGRVEHTVEKGEWPSIAKARSMEVCVLCMTRR